MCIIILDIVQSIVIFIKETKMIQNIIKKIRCSNVLTDNERELLESVISNPKHEGYMELYLAGLV